MKPTVPSFRPNRPSQHGAMRQRLLGAGHETCRALQRLPHATPSVGSKYVKGFTVIELMVTLAVAAILLAIAIPSFNYLMVSSKLTTTANAYVYALNIARSEAIKRNADVTVATTGAVTMPAPATTISAPITVQAPVNMNIPSALTAKPIGLLTTGGAAGFTGLAADISSTAISSNNHRCVYVVTGTTVSTCTDSSACAAGGPSANCH